MSAAAAGGRVLIADDEVRFRKSVAAFLEKEGFRCETVGTGDAASERLEQENFDLLIADIYMPGNERLQLVREGPLRGVPVILVTGKPTLDTAVESVRLPVVGYLVKPFRFELLKTEVDRALEASRLYATLARARERLGSWATALEASEKLKISRVPNSAPVSVEAFLDVTLRNVSEALVDMARLTAGLYGGEAAPTNVCHLFQCPRLVAFNEAIEETIEVLESTKRSFKSKELGALRHKLEELKNRRSN